jgi:hypothetical protein
MTGISKRTLQYFNLRCDGPKGLSNVENVNWEAIINTWNCDHRTNYRNDKGILICANFDESFPTVTFHSEVSRNHKMEVDSRGLLRDAQENSSPEEWKLSYSSVAVIIPQTMTVLYAKGDKGAPNKDLLLDLLNQVSPLEHENKWSLHPIVKKGQMREFNKNKAPVICIEATYRTTSDLFDEDIELGGFESAFQDLSNSAGQDLRIQLTIQPLTGKTKRGNLAGLLNIKRPERFTKLNVRTMIESQLADGTYAQHTELINLVDTHLTRSIELSSEPTFSELKRAVLAKAKAELHNG